MEAMRAIVELPPPCLSDFWKDVDGNSSPWSPAFEDFVSRCLTKEPEQRPTGISLTLSKINLFSRQPVSLWSTPTAVMLLSHPFMASAMHQKVLYKSLSRRNKLLKQNQAKKARPRLAQLFSKAREKSIREEIDRRDWDEEEDSEKSNSLTEGRSEDREPSGEIIDENQKGSAFLMTESLSPTEAKVIPPDLHSACPATNHDLFRPPYFQINLEASLCTMKHPQKANVCAVASSKPCPITL